MLRKPSGGITMTGKLATQVAKDLRVHLGGYGPSTVRAQPRQESWWRFLERRKGSVVSNIGREELQAKMDRGDLFILLEVLAPRYYRHSHLPGALNLPPGKAAEMASELVPDKNAEIVLYCWDAGWPTSPEAARELAAMGYTNVWEYREGKKAWIAAGLPVEGRSRRPRQWWR
jgi:rhodanese-related sulfurtransferase